MRELQICLCDDEQFYRDSLTQLLLTFVNEESLQANVIPYDNPLNLLEDITQKKKQCDILFLDVDMPQMQGLKVAETLREDGYEGEIMFATSYTEYTRMAYLVEAMGYLEKPIQYVMLKKLMKKAVIQASFRLDEEEANKRYLEVTVDRAKRIIDLHKILYLEKQRNRCIIHLEDGEIVCYESMKDLYSRLDQSVFVYTHQGYIANKDKIIDVQTEYVFFADNRQIPVSRRFYKILREDFLKRIKTLRKEMVGTMY